MFYNAYWKLPLSYRHNDNKIGDRCFDNCSNSIETSFALDYYVCKLGFKD